MVRKRSQKYFASVFWQHNGVDHPTKVTDTPHNGRHLTNFSGMIEYMQPVEFEQRKKEILRLLEEQERLFEAEKHRIETEFAEKTKKLEESHQQIEAIQQTITEAQERGESLDVVLAEKPEPMVVPEEFTELHEALTHKHAS